MAKSENEIYYFLKSKLKERGISINTFHEMCGFSKATLYRVMKGYQKPTQAQRDKIATLLKMDTIESEAFNRTIKMLEFTENQLQSFSVIGDILSKGSEQTDTEPFEFIVYDTGKVIKTYDEIIDLVKKNSQKNNFYCDIKIYSCIDTRILQPVESLLDELGDARISVEHLVKFYRDDDFRNVQTFQTVIPFLKHISYNLFSRKIDGGFTHEFIDNMILIRTPGQHIVLIFNQSKYHECYLSIDKKWYSLFLNRWNDAMLSHKQMIKERNIDMLLELYHDNEVHGDTVVFKSDPGYNLIKREIWEAVKNRMTDDAYQSLYNFISSNGQGRKKANSHLASFIDLLDKRYRASSKNPCIYLCSKQGLEAFMETGRMSDHYDFLPSFTKAETKAILKNMIDRHNDPEDKFTLLVFDGEMDSRLCLCAGSSGTFSIGYNHPNKTEIFNCFFSQKQLSQNFISFVKKYAPDNFCMPEEAADEFLRNLIK